MAQFIECRLEGEQGNIIEKSELNFAQLNKVLFEVDQDKKHYIWLHTIDEYGNTVFNPLQTPYVLAELEKLRTEVNEDTQELINKFIKFINKIGLHKYIRFLGD